MSIKDISIGQTAELSKQFTDDDVKMFASISLDNNPIHLSDDFAKKSIFKKKIIHGFLSGSLISAVIGTKLPGNGAIYLNQVLNFKKPVYIGDTIKAVIEVTDIKYEKSTLVLKTICYNQTNEIVIDGSAIIKL